MLAGMTTTQQHLLEWVYAHPLHIVVRDPARRARARFIQQPVEALAEKARAPLADGLLGQAQFARDDGIRLAGGALEHQSRALGEGAGGRRSACPTLQRVAFVLGEGQRWYGPSRAHGRSSFYRRNAC